MFRHSFVYFLVVFVLVSWAQADATLEFQIVVDGLERPVALAHAGDGSDRLFVVEQPGRIRVIQDGTLLSKSFLDLTGLVESGGERGLLGLAFHPLYENNGRFFVNYTRLEGPQLRTVVAEFQVSENNPNLAVANPTTLLEFDQPFVNHNGGMLAFGPDGLLYISTGDGGSGGDPQNNGQNLENLLGKILRIDVDGSPPYEIPPDNPFVGVNGVRKEIFAYGFRNPWRFSFDRATGQLFVGDVGQNNWEEVDIVVKGGNYGWRIMEGSQCFNPSVGCNMDGLTLPIAEYSHAEGASITGGFMYRGPQETPLWGTYLFADFSTGKIWNLTQKPGFAWERRLLTDSNFRISSFGEDEQGNLYVLNLNPGQVVRIEFGWQERFAQVGDGVSSVGTFQSTLIVINEEDEQLVGNVRFISSDGEDFSQRPFQVAAREAVAMETGGDTNPVFVGWAEVTANRRFSGMILFGLKSPGGEPLREAGVADSEAGESFKAYVSRKTAIGTDTGFALANVSNSQTVEITIVLTESGQVIASTLIELGPREHTAQFIGAIDGVPSDFAGTAEIAATGEIIVTLLRTKNGIHFSGLPVGR